MLRTDSSSQNTCRASSTSARKPGASARERAGARKTGTRAGGRQPRSSSPRPSAVLYSSVMQLAEVLPYVKAEEPAEEGATVVELPEGAQLALKPFVGRLHIAYAVD